MGMLIQKTGSFLFCCQRNCVVLGDVYHALKIVFFFLILVVLGLGAL